MKSINENYISNVKKAIKHIDKNSEKLIRNLKNEVDIFISGHPDTTYNDLITTFGSPDEIAESVYHNMDTKEIKKQKKLKSYIIIAIVIVVLIIAICIIHYYSQLNKDLPSYTIDNINMIEE